jgi:hypothetical protein
LNPNEAIVQAVTIPAKKIGLEIVNKCYSNPTLAKEEIDTLNRVLSKKYPAICQALQDYKPLLEASRTIVEIE